MPHEKALVIGIREESPANVYQDTTTTSGTSVGEKKEQPSSPGTQAGPRLWRGDRH